MKHVHLSFASLLQPFLGHGALAKGCGILVLCASVAIAAEDEPSYQGRVLSEWLGDMTFHGVPIGPGGPIEEAIQVMGTNALPTLLKWISYEPSHSELVLDGKVPNLGLGPITNLNRYPVQRAKRSVYAFGKLGAAARPAIPELTRLARGSSGNGQADLFVRALVSIGSEAVPNLVSLATNSPPWTRYSAVQALGFFCDEPAVVTPLLPMFMTFLFDTNTQYAVAGPAQAALLGMDPNVVVPALTNALQSPSDYARRRAIETLLGFDTIVPPAAVPSLRAAMRDPDPTVRDLATTILRQMGGWERVGEQWVRRHGTNTLNGITPDFFTNAPPR